MNADILLDLTKVFKLCPSTQQLVFSLKLEEGDPTSHPFCNDNLMVLPNKITKHVWLALKKGLTTRSPFVRGHQGDIYELRLSSEHSSEYRLRITAYNQDFVIHANLRILIKYCKNVEKFCVVPRRHNNCKFEICLLRMENTIKTDNVSLVTIIRLMRFLFETCDDFSSLDWDFVEAIALFELMHNKKFANDDYNYLFHKMLLRTFKTFKTKKLPHIWSTMLNLVDWINDNTCEYAFAKSIRLLDGYNIIRDRKDLTYAEFCAYF